MAVELSPAGLLTAIAQDLDVSVVAVGTMTTFYSLGDALLVLPLTALAIRFARSSALTAVMIVFVASNRAVAIAASGRFVGGASYGVISPPSSSVSPGPVMPALRGSRPPTLAGEQPTSGAPG